MGNVIEFRGEASAPRKEGALLELSALLKQMGCIDARLSLAFPDGRVERLNVLELSVGLNASHIPPYLMTLL